MKINETRFQEFQEALKRHGFQVEELLMPNIYIRVIPTKIPQEGVLPYDTIAMVSLATYQIDVGYYSFKMLPRESQRNLYKTVISYMFNEPYC